MLLEAPYLGTVHAKENAFKGEACSMVGQNEGKRGSRGHAHAPGEVAGRGSDQGR